LRYKYDNNGDRLGTTDKLRPHKPYKRKIDGKNNDALQGIKKAEEIR
jgi:hypothetical protein